MIGNTQISFEAASAQHLKPTDTNPIPAIAEHIMKLVAYTSQFTFLFKWITLSNSLAAFC